jgi:uncharacterized protein YpmB
MVMIVIIVVIFILVLLAVLLIKRQNTKEDEEVRIEYRTSTTSDLEYDDLTALEEKDHKLDIGPTPMMDPEEERRRLYGED